MNRFLRFIHHEAVIWLLGLLTAIAGHGAATSLLDRLEGRESNALIPWIVVFVILTLFFYALYENPFPQRLTRALKWWVSIAGSLPWLIGDIAVICLFGVAVLAHRGLRAVATPIFAGYLAGLIASTIGFFTLRKNLLVIHSRYLRGEKFAVDAPPKSTRHTPRHMIAMLSTAAEFRENDYLPFGVTLSDPPDLAADLETLANAKKRKTLPQSPPRRPSWCDRLSAIVRCIVHPQPASAAPPRQSRNWPWEMLLRGVYPHRASLCDLTLVCSRESLPEAPFFVRVLRRYPELRGLPINVWAERGCVRSLHAADDPAVTAKLRGFDFGDLDELSSAMTDLLKYLQFGRRFPARHILVDFTGGQKPVSVVGAALTLRGEIRAQYVDTNDLTPTTYDLVSNPEVKGGA